MARRCVNDHCPFNSDEANDGCLIIPEDIADNMDGECPKKIVVARANIAELKAKLADWKETHRRIIDEPCREDEKHCTCVPALRSRIAELEVDSERLDWLEGDQCECVFGGGRTIAAVSKFIYDKDGSFLRTEMFKAKTLTEAIDAARK